MTDDAWEAIHAFPTGARWSTVGEQGGLDVPGRRDQRYGEPGPLLVFVHGGAVVQAIAVTPPLQLGLDRAARFEVGEATVLVVEGAQMR